MYSQQGSGTLCVEADVLTCYFYYCSSFSLALFLFVSLCVLSAELQSGVLSMNFLLLALALVKLSLMILSDHGWAVSGLEVDG